MTVTHATAHPAWCARALCTGRGENTEHTEVGDVLAPVAEPSSTVAVARVQIGDDPAEIVLSVMNGHAPLSRDEARDLGRLLTRYANTTG